MKKTWLGAGLIAVAVYVLFGNRLQLPEFGISIWALLFIVGFGVSAIQNVLQKNYTSAYISGVISVIILENQFNWLRISTGTMIFAAILAGIGLSMLLKPKSTVSQFKDFQFGDGISDTIHDTIDGTYSSNNDSDTVFGNTTRYINDENLTRVGGDVVFSGTSIYFANATILGDQAIYSGDAVFSSVKLYVPKDWHVEFTGDKVFSSIKSYPSGGLSGKILVVTGDYVFSQLEIIYI